MRTFITRGRKDRIEASFRPFLCFCDVNYCLQTIIYILLFLSVFLIVARPFSSRERCRGARRTRWFFSIFSTSSVLPCNPPSPQGEGFFVFVADARILYHVTKRKKKGHRMMVGIFALRRFFALPLTSELDALCGSNANPATSSPAQESSIPLPKERKKTIK